MKIYRDWQLSGDEELLARLWPNVRKALEFCWIPGGWDADRDGVMEGCQHNTMDVEYFGPNPQMGSWYLGALRAAEEMARHLGEDDFAAQCRRLFESGRDLDRRQPVQRRVLRAPGPPRATRDEIAPGLLVGMGGTDLTDPDFQLGAGCLVDQLVGQFMAHVCGLGYLLDPAHVRRRPAKASTATTSGADFSVTSTTCGPSCWATRAALLMATYPHSGRPETRSRTSPKS